MEESHTMDEWKIIYFKRADRLMFWSMILDFFLLHKWSKKLSDKAEEYLELAFFV